MKKKTKPEPEEGPKLDIQLGDIVIADTETTDLVKTELVKIELQPHIVEFAAIRLNIDTLQEVASINMRINPGVPIPAESSKVTGIFDEHVKDCPSFSDVSGDICSFFTGTTILVGHNIEFDTSMIHIELKRAGLEKRFPWPVKHIDTVNASSHLTKKWLTLSELYEIATGRKLIGAHGALVDCKATAVCLRWLIENKHLTIK